MKTLIFTLTLGLAIVSTTSHVQAQGTPAPAAAQEVFFCWWNVENMFDDRDDDRNSIDKEFDIPFAKNEKLRNLKFDRIASALMKMNDGKGPDVIALCEVENVRAADLLKAALNKKLVEAKLDKSFEYKHVAMRNLDAGRHIAPAVISRVNVAHALTKMHGNKLRILESHLYVNGHDLCIMATHWTSQLKQDNGGNGDSGREKYANAIYEQFRLQAKKNVNCDFLLCGDFNDVPDATPIVKNLGAIGDKAKVVPTDNEPYLYSLTSGKDPTKFGTLWYNNKPLIYDHICVSPGMLDKQGWSIDLDSFKTQTDGLIRKGATRREPWRFGSPDRDIPDDERGYSDHFPLTVKLKVQPPKGK